MATDDPEALLVTGAYGTGKTTVVEELATTLEERGAPFAAIDLDWLAWANVPDAHGSNGERVRMANLAAVVENYVAERMRLFLLAGLVASREERSRMEDRIRMPLRVVRLVVPIEEIERRLGRNPATGRQDDLREARLQADERIGEGVEDLAVRGDRPIGEVAAEILDWVGWA
jgi:adenylylsulfate kinase-like enzyme